MDHLLSQMLYVEFKVWLGICDTQIRDEYLSDSIREAKDSAEAY